VGPKKRFWYLVDADGNRVERDGKEPKIHGKNPFQAVQKAVTRYATEANTEYTFHLREAKGKPTKAGKLRVYTYKGWKTPLTDAERSEFTVNMSITSKPHAKSMGVTLIDAPPAKKRARKAKAGEVEASTEAAQPAAEAPKKRARKAKVDGQAAAAEGGNAAAEPPAKKKRAGKAAQAGGEAATETPAEAAAAEAPKTPKKRGGKAKPAKDAAAEATAE